MTDLFADRWKNRLVAMQREVRDRLRTSMAAQDLERQSRAARDDAGDTIFGIDVDAESVVLAHCTEWAATDSFVLIAEGLEEEGRAFGVGPPTARVILDPIDGTRGLMFDKRSAWSLGAVAPERSPEPRLADLTVAVMSELPTTRQTLVEVLTARRGRGTARARTDLVTGRSIDLEPQPSTATDLRHGFATVCNFFQGGKELTSRIEEDLLGRALGGWTTSKAEVYTDQYISSGGQLAELVMGRDRLVLDIRPLVHRALGESSTLCSRPYDLCTALIAEEAGCVVEAPRGEPLDGPLDTTTNLSFVGYANATLAASLRPHVRAVLDAHGV